MILKRIKVKTPLLEYTNCYVVVDEELKEAMVIDPAGDVDKIQEMIKEKIMENEDIVKFIDGKEIVKEIYIPGRMYTIVVK